MDRSASARLPKAPRWCLARLTAPLHTSLILPVWPTILPSYPSYPSHPSYPSYPSSHHLATAPPRLQTLEDKAYEVRQRRYQANLNAVELFDTAIARQREWLEAESTEVEQDWAGAELLAREARDRAAAASKLVDGGGELQVGARPQPSTCAYARPQPSMRRSSCFKGSVPCACSSSCASCLARAQMTALEERRAAAEELAAAKAQELLGGRASSQPHQATRPPTKGREPSRRVGLSAEVSHDHAAASAPTAKGALEGHVQPKTTEERELIHVAVGESTLFAGITDEQRDQLVDAMQEVPVAQGEVVISEGDEGHDFFVVRSGVFAAFALGNGETPVHTYSQGGAFGELALLYNRPRAASIRCEAPGSLYALGRPTFRSVLRRGMESTRESKIKLLGRVSALEGLTAPQLQVRNKLRSNRHQLIHARAHAALSHTRTRTYAQPHPLVHTVHRRSARS